PHRTQRWVSFRLGMATKGPLAPSITFKSLMTKSLSIVMLQKARSLSLFADMSLIRTSVISTACCSFRETSFWPGRSSSREISKALEKAQLKKSPAPGPDTFVQCRSKGPEPTTLRQLRGVDSARLTLDRKHLSLDFPPQI